MDRIRHPGKERFENLPRLIQIPLQKRGRQISGEAADLPLRSAYVAVQQIGAERFGNLLVREVEPEPAFVETNLAGFDRQIPCLQQQCYRVDVWNLERIERHTGNRFRHRILKVEVGLLGKLHQERRRSGGEPVVVELAVILKELRYGYRVVDRLRSLFETVAVIPRLELPFQLLHRDILSLCSCFDPITEIVFQFRLRITKHGRIVAVHRNIG